mmetsp:Transcript_112887/g.364621  ORF Transcript_112887/g.364621 Transcript_112887/m.364621 type:complete len:337 (-) Transcript_112887:68-1078(-)
MVSLGYHGVVQKDPKRSSDHPAGNATFWRDEMFRLEAEVSRSRTLTTLLTDASKRGIAVVNCHLEGDPHQASTRVKQLQTALKQVASMEHHAMVVLGDFNCDLRTSASAAYLAFGSVPDGVQEWGRDVPPAAGDVPGHGYSLSSAYNVDSGDEFTFTIRGTSVWFLDQLWYTPSALEAVATRSAFHGPEHRKTILDRGLPSADDPSDHLPIAAAFRWTSASLPSLATAGAAALAPAPAVPAHALEREAEELLAACPMSEVQRTEWLRVTTLPPSLPKGGKPAPEQLAAMKELQRQKEAFLAEVGEDAEAMLLRAQQLSRKAMLLRAQQLSRKARKS